MEKNIMLRAGDTVGIVACSNGLKKEQEKQVRELARCLEGMGLTPVFSNHIYERYGVFSGTGKERAQDMMGFVEDSKIRAIFDISGGDLANQVLEYLDYDKVKKAGKPFFGYSDLSVLLNGIYQKTGLCTYLYQVRNLVREDQKEQRRQFFETFFEGKDSLYEVKWRWIQGDCMEGTVVGGNIRCLLKLAGTPYFPDCTDKILFLESLGGEEAVMTAFFTQLRQMGVFAKVRGILLGTFTKMQQTERVVSVEELLRRIVRDPALPIAKTEQIGHGADAKCLVLGSNQKLQKNSAEKYLTNTISYSRLTLVSEN